MKLVDKEVNKWKKINKIILLVNSIDISYESSISLNLNCNFENISDDQPSIDTIFFAFFRISSFFLFSVLFIFPICSYFFFKTKGIFMS